MPFLKEKEFTEILSYDACVELWLHKQTSWVQLLSKTNPCSQVVEGEEYKPFGFYSRSVLRINVTETVNYTCYAINQMMGGRQSSDQKSFMVYVESTEGKKTF